MNDMDRKLWLHFGFRSILGRPQAGHFILRIKSASPAVSNASSLLYRSFKMSSYDLGFAACVS
jgi:hypothetical protein